MGRARSGREASQPLKDAREALSAVREQINRSAHPRDWCRAQRDRGRPCLTDPRREPGPPPVQQPVRVPPAPPPGTAPPMLGADERISDPCTTDKDCTLTSYRDLSEGCCPHVCGSEVVSRSRAAAWEAAYKARCNANACPPHDCAFFSNPTPVCRELRCVARTPR